MAEHLVPIPQRFFITAFFTPYDFQWDSHFTFLGEKHDSWEVVYVLAGEVECTEDERIYHLKAGDMLFHAPQEFHKIRSYARTEPHVFVFSFESTGSLPERLKDGILSLSPEEQKTYEALFDRAKAIYGGALTEPDSIFLCGLELTAFFFRLAAGHEASRQLSPSRPAREYQKLVLAMSRGVRKNYALQDFALQCSISISYMKELFARYAGVSPKAYYSKLRCEEAVRLLEAGMTVQETAEEMGFSSASYFSEFFKKHLGIPPARFIRRQSEKP